ncbi:hypothetical protein ACIA5C_32870 [Actinoplanes sp. NPDC051343]|uniref:hypothetical protein n=1 Tax=Actinoplanes sp. NPDC051343 TaxID=3363906 RepID=UPI00378D9758
MPARDLLAAGVGGDAVVALAVCWRPGSAAMPWWRSRSAGGRGRRRCRGDACGLAGRLEGDPGGQAAA